MRELAMWYFIMGFITSVIGIFRGIRNKSMEPDELTLMSWFLLWWVWLPFFSGRWLYFLVFKGKSI